MNARQAPPGLLLLTLNVCGLTGSKLVTLLSWLKEKRVDIAVLTETKLSSSVEDLLRRVPGAGALWPGARILSCPGNGHTLGIAVVLGPTCQAMGPAVFQGADGAGRLLRLDITIRTQPCSLIAIYGPAQTQHRREFYREAVRPFLPADGRPILLAGDFNCVLDAEDCVYSPNTAGPSTNSRLIGAAELDALMQEYQLRDVWREANPGAHAYSHWSHPSNSGGRLDRWLASASFLTAFAATSDILPGSSIPTDHLPVTLQLQRLQDDAPRGRGLQGFPLHLLNMPTACNELANTVAALTTVLLADPDDTTIVKRWDATKEVIRARAWDILRRHQRARREEALAAEAAAREARARLIHAPPGADPGPLVANIRLTATTLRTAWERMAAGPAAALRILDHHFSDTGSFYFHQLSRPPHEPTIIRKLNRPGRPPGAPTDTATLADQAGVDLALDYASAFFSSASPIGLFREHPDIDPAAQEELLATMHRRLPPCYVDMAEGLDGDSLLSKEDVEQALRQAKRGSTPGIDGLPYEFYRAFKDTLVPVLVRVFNAAFQAATEDAPLLPLLMGIICLLHKPGQPVDEISGYRPITLLNCDVKLVMLIMANRLQMPLEYLIDITQSAFLRGRDICDNIRYNLGLAARLVELNIPGWLLNSDLTKAYDSVNRGWLTKVMLTMGLKDTGIVRWTRIMLNGSQAKVRVNGFFTAAFPVTSSLAQGSAASCMHWLIVMQPFISYLNQLAHQGRLPTLPMPDQSAAPAATTFADDNNALIRDPDGEGAVLIMAAHDKYRRAGGPALSVPKTTLTTLISDGRATMDAATRTHHPTTGFRLQPLGQVPRILGVPMAATAADQAHAAYGNMANKMTISGAAWAPLLLNQMGRVHVARQCLASKPVYQANATMPGARDLAAMQQSINRFVARSGRAEEETPLPHHLFPGQQVMMLPSDRGGVGLPHLQSHFYAMAAKTAWLLFQHTTHPWQVLFRHESQLAAPPRAGIPPGYHWLVTDPNATGRLDNVRSLLLKTAISAFLLLGVQRILAPEEQEFESVMLELTFQGHTTVGTADRSTNLRLSDVNSADARGWLRLSDVRQAHLHRGQLSEEARTDLATVLAALPAAWRAHILAPQPPPSPWTALHAPGDPARIFEGPNLQTGAICLWELWPSGRLQLLPEGTPRPPTQPRPALIMHQPKAREAWTRADLEFMAAQSALPPAQREDILEPYLVGIWQDLQLDPRVWGIKTANGQTVSLLGLTVRDARLVLTHRFLQHQRIPGYSEEQAAWPKAWSMAPDGGYTDQPETAAGTRHLEQLGILGHEERWRRRARERAGTTLQGDVDQVDAWFRRDAGLAPAEPRATHNSQQHAPAQQGRLRQGHRLCWKRLCDPTLHRPFKITCWRILHCTLGCNAFLAYARPHTDASAAAAKCGAPACADAGHDETLSHAFLDCPEVRPVIDWLLATWQRLTGRTVPRTTRVLLADDPGGWLDADRPSSTSAYQLWTRLRVATLGAIWRVRCSRDEGQANATFAYKVVTMATEALLEAIKRDWLRTHTDVRQLDGGAFCNDWWRGFDVKLTVDGFIKTWADPPILCEVRGAAPASSQEPDMRTLSLRFGLDEPVVRPGAAAGQPAPPPPVTPAATPPAAPPAPAAPPLTDLATTEAPDGGDTPPEAACPICHRRLDMRPTTTTICGHMFHLDCLNRWTALRASCPICRRGIPAVAGPAGIG